MGDICIHVYKQTRLTARYAPSRNISVSVFKQACLFTGAFYFTWVPYIALQYMWSSGKSFSNYGFILYAAITVPMQGFCNCLVYVRPRYKERIYESVTSFAQSIPRRLSFQSRQSTTQMQNDKSEEEHENWSKTSLTWALPLAFYKNLGFSREKLFNARLHSVYVVTTVRMQRVCNLLVYFRLSGNGLVITGIKANSTKNRRNIHKLLFILLDWCCALFNSNILYLRKRHVQVIRCLLHHNIWSKIFENCNKWSNLQNQ